MAGFLRRRPRPWVICGRLEGALLCPGNCRDRAVRYVRVIGPSIGPTASGRRWCFRDARDSCADLQAAIAVSWYSQPSSLIRHARAYRAAAGQSAPLPLKAEIRKLCVHRTYRQCVLKTNRTQASRTMNAETAEAVTDRVN